MPACNVSQIATLAGSRNFLQYPDPSVCGMQTCFYGDECQKMQVTLGDRPIRSSANIIRTWERRRRQWCEIARTETPPGTPTATIDFYELCLPGIPLAYRLEDCQWGVLINHGTCYGASDPVNGWSQYTEYLRLTTTGRNGGRRTSYDGAGDALSLSLTADVDIHNIYGPMQFSEIPISMECDNPSLRADSVTFGCNVGCGNSYCGCAEACDDGTYTFYYGLSCVGGTQNLLSYSTDGGETIKTCMIPLPATSGGVLTELPKVAVCNNKLYVLAYQDPVSLFAINLDVHGAPTGSWTELAVLGQGKPGEIICDDDRVHILVTGTDSYYYTLDFNRDPNDGPRHTWEAVEMSTMIACGRTIMVGGANTALEISIDTGKTWSQHSVPANATGIIESIQFSGIYTFITTSDGQVYRTNDGTTWRQIVIPGVTAGSLAGVRFGGENEGWAWNGTSIFNTWLGGLNGPEWTNGAPRILGWPTTFTPTSIVTPDCANTRLRGNSVMIMGTRADGSAMALLGRALESGC